MVNQNSIFGGMLTTAGAAKKTNCDALGVPWEPSYMLIGDANGADPVPSPGQTKLINQVYRAPLNQLYVSPTDPNVLVAELVLPPNVGGWWIRELALEDIDGVFSAVANCAPSYKPLLVQGSGRNQVVRMHVVTSGTANIQLKIDPSVVLATREFVTEELAKQDFKHSVLAATTGPIVLSGLQTIDTVVLPAGAAVLVKNQVAAKDNGIYVVAEGAWSRRADADTSAKVTPGLLVHVEKGSVNGDAGWQLVTDGPINLGVSALAFEMAFGRTGVVAGTYRSVTVDKYGRVVGATNPTTLASYGITDAQPLDSDLTALAALTANGFYVNTGEGSVAARSIAVGSGLSVSNGDGVAGNPMLTNTGVTSVAGTANQVIISGANGPVTFSLPQSINTGASPTFAQINLAADPTNALHAATKQYVDNLLSGLDIKASVVVATTANITLSGTQVIDGVAVVVGNRVLVKNQTTPSQNGLYLVAAGGWTRTTDADAWAELVSAFVFIEKGTVNADTGWVCTVDPGGTLGTTAVTISQFSGAGTVTAGAGIDVTGNQVSLTVSGVAAGAYPKVTVDQYGRVTAGAPLVAADIPGLDWTKISTGKPTTLGGYGIVVPTQLQAETGTDNALPMTPLRVFQAIAKVVVQATETAFGWAKVATQLQTNTGTDDTTMVTPLKLRWGVSYLIAENGYVALPSWLGGLIIQWGKATITTNSTGGVATVSLPYSYPNNHFGATGNYRKGVIISDSFPVSTYPTSLSTLTLVLDAATGGSTPSGAQEAFYISVGN